MSAPRGAFLRLSAAAALAYCSYAMCRSPVLPLFARGLGASPELVGFVVAASTITGIFVKLPAGALSDVLGRRALLVAGGLVFAILPFAYLPMTSLIWLIAVRVVHGNATAVFGPVASATVSDLAPPESRGRWLSLYSTAQGAGQASGSLLAGYLLAFGGFKSAFLVSGVLGAAALVLLIGHSGAPRTRSRESWLGRAAAGVREVATNRRILTVSLVQAGQLLVNGSLNAFVPLFAYEALGLSAAEIGLIFATQTVATLVARPAFGALSDRWGRSPMIVTGLWVCGVAVAMISRADGFAALLGATGLYGMGVAVTSSATSAYVTDLARRARYGAAHGIFGTIYDIGDALGPIVAGFLIAAIGYRQTFRITAASAVLLGLTFLLSARGWQKTQRPTGSS